MSGLSIIDQATSAYLLNPGNTIPDDFKEKLRSSSYATGDVQRLLNHVTNKWMTGNVVEGNIANARGWKQELEAIVEERHKRFPARELGDVKMQFPDPPVW